jgi:hypothetical protein
MQATERAIRGVEHCLVRRVYLCHLRHMSLPKSTARDEQFRLTIGPPPVL